MSTNDEPEESPEEPGEEPAEVTVSSAGEQRERIIELLEELVGGSDGGS